MPSAAAIRQEIESSLAARIPGALSVRFHHSRELVPTGIAEVDALLHGGLPLGGLTESPVQPAQEKPSWCLPFLPKSRSRKRPAPMSMWRTRSIHSPELRWESILGVCSGSVLGELRNETRTPGHLSIRGCARRIYCSAREG